jgi:hypothetical protein
VGVDISVPTRHASPHRRVQQGRPSGKWEPRPPTALRSMQYPSTICLRRDMFQMQNCLGAGDKT